jgi:hypothetical protein
MSEPCENQINAADEYVPVAFQVTSRFAQLSPRKRRHAIHRNDPSLSVHGDQRAQPGNWRQFVRLEQRGRDDGAKVRQRFVLKNENQAISARPAKPNGRTNVEALHSGSQSGTYHMPSRSS